MQGAIVRVCMVVVAILNEPLLYPRENGTLSDKDGEVIKRMQEYEKRQEVERARLEKELPQPDSKQEETSLEEDYSWYFWSVVSFITFFIIEMCRVQGGADAEIGPVEDEDVLTETGPITPRTLVLDKEILSNFCDKCAYASAHENWRVREFVEGLADDLLESLRSVCNIEADGEVGDFVGIGSMFESWKVCKPLICDLIVPFSPPDPYSFKFQLWCSPSSDVPPDRQGCGKIMVTQLEKNKEGCVCGSANLGEDMLCLLHARDDALKADHSPDELLCSRNTRLLAKDQVMRWFQISITKAWGRISHKYDFEVTFRNLDAAGALRIRFRSGKVIVMNLIPVVQLEDTDAYFVSHFPSDCDSTPDPYWPLSFAVYERNLLKYFAQRVPQNSCHLRCLQIISFLHRKQTGLTGKSALTNYHIKTAVLHLLLSKRPSAWGMESVEHRLRDVLSFLQRSLHEKRLHHVLIGNIKVPEEVKVPEIVRKAEPVNLFRSLVLQRDLYAATVCHFHEMLRNAPMLIQEYTPAVANGGVHHRLD